MVTFKRPFGIYKLSSSALPSLSEVYYLFDDYLSALVHQWKLMCHIVKRTGFLRASLVFCQLRVIYRALSNTRDHQQKVYSGNFSQLKKKKKRQTTQMCRKTNFKIEILSFLEIKRMLHRLLGNGMEVEQEGRYQKRGCQKKTLRKGEDSPGQMSKNLSSLEKQIHFSFLLINPFLGGENQKARIREILYFYFALFHFLIKCFRLFEE